MVKSLIGFKLMCAVALAAAWTCPAVAAISLDDESSPPLSVASDGATSLVLDSELGVAASAGINDATAEAGDFHYDAHAKSSAGVEDGASTGPVSGEIVFDKTPLPLPGDVNEDLCVDFSDFLILQDNFGLSGKTWSEGDLNGDGSVDFSDFLILQDHFGDCWVPEPMSLAIWSVLFAAGVGCVYGRRWRRGKND